MIPQLTLAALLWFYISASACNHTDDGTGLEETGQTESMSMKSLDKRVNILVKCNNGIKLRLRLPAEGVSDGEADGLAEGVKRACHLLKDNDGVNLVR